ncbi:MULTISPECIES: archaellar assembly protein FlaJ [Haloferax]|jgi:flagellar protein FlaJ|uniref:Archaellar assembly protein FlaJ n=3 Tax=Haloferax TaxID=2251 RepID=A0A6C0USZ4_HALVO|nr:MULTISPECIES: archaellar assembly protein FlaJ [Haloferax]ELK53181.1 flagellar assembly protein J [Haloferax sp. BAB-2207]ELZ93487.1 flagellar assembly protein J [Haloferax alexandrinus JCM 10717]MBC9985979.1 archaellar assembly protein FlaJ [Haloferax sp. AS1]NLV02134.1 archaellar assembly protein FlaJ [Haloferax alexandrinus]QIB78317.1 archaellar assembly protein FlaJ [Haloferax alexandrinus]
MAGEQSTSMQAVQVRDFISDIIESYEQMPMELPRYLLAVLGPAIVFFFLSVAGAIALPLPLLVRIPVFLLGVLLLGGAVLYPRLLVEQTRRSLENQLHLLITHMTVLSTTNIDRVAVFRTLAREEEYGELATEMNRIVQLVDAWNQSLDDACQRRAREVPSKPLADFLDRLAYSINAGQSIDDFLLGEQNAMIQKYITVYESALGNLEVMKDLYLSMILSMTFAIINAIVLPILTGTDATMTIGAVIVLFVFVQLGFYFVIRTMSPHDPLWYHQREYRTKANRQIDITLYGAVGLSITMVLVLALGTFNLTPVGATVRPIMIELPIPLLISTPLTPLAVPGIVARRHEKRIGERDEEYPGFIRALGASETAKQSTTTAVLKTLKTKDFGVLSREIARLYTRLRMRLDPDRSWFFFTAETNSYLVQKFSEMYNVGRSMGGKPKLLGELISRNMNEIIKLRRQRKQSTVTLIGVLYGITASASFAFFIGLEVVEILASFSTEMNLDSLQFGTLIYAGVYDVPFIEYMLTLIILFNALLSSLMIRMVDGGHKANAYLHFVMLVWVGSLMAVATSSLAGALISV